MSASHETSTSPDPHCPRCGAVVPPGTATCWLCYSPLETSLAGVTSGRAAAVLLSPARSHSFAPAGGFSLASLMLFITLACVVLGVSTIAPGVGIPLGVLLLIVWLRTTAVTRRRIARGLDVTWAEQAQLFLASLGVTVGLLVLVCVAGGAAFAAACFACAGVYLGLEAGQWRDVALPLGWVVFVVVAAAIAIPLLILIKKLDRRLWKRDIDERD